MSSRPRFGLLFAVAGTAACAAIASFEPLDFYDPGADASPEGSGPDGASDAVAPTDAPSSSDANDDGDVVDGGFDADADARPPPTCYEIHDGGYDGAAIVFCDDFERDSGVGNGWSAVVEANGGTVTLTNAAATSGTRSVVVDIPSGASGGTKSAYLRTVVLPAQTPMVLEADFRIVTAPPAGSSYPTNGFTFGRSRVVNDGFKDGFVRVVDAGVFDPFFYVSDPSSSYPQNAWCHLTWHVNGTGVGQQKLDVYDKAAPGTIVTRTADEPVAPKDFWIGAETDADLGPVHMYIDDVVIHE